MLLQYVVLIRHPYISRTVIILFNIVLPKPHAGLFFLLSLVRFQINMLSEDQPLRCVEFHIKRIV